MSNVCHCEVSKGVSCALTHDGWRVVVVGDGMYYGVNMAIESVDLKIYNVGFASARSRVDTSNPYPDFSDEAFAWCLGYFDGLRAKMLQEQKAA